MNALPKVRFGVIGGSGLYKMEGCRLIREVNVKTPFGEPSSSIAIVEIDGIPVAFLPRHGKGHYFTPTEVNYRANIYALKSLGVEEIISVGATGSLQEEISPGDLVIPSQAVDKTRQRPQSFFGRGIVAHIPFDRPFCPRLSSFLTGEIKALGFKVHTGGVYVCMEGPAFSTKAESLEHKSLGYSIVGMTGLPEAKLAREAEMCFILLAFITDYDCWKENVEGVTVQMVLENLKRGVANVQRVIRSAVPRLLREKRTNCNCGQALTNAIITDLRYVNKITAKKLDLLVGRYLGKPPGFPLVKPSHGLKACCVGKNRKTAA